MRGSIPGLSTYCVVCYSTYIASFLYLDYFSASVDNLRLWNVADAAEGDGFGRTKSGAQFKIIPGHHGGYISQMSKGLYPRFVISIYS